MYFLDILREDSQDKFVEDMGHRKVLHSLENEIKYASSVNSRMDFSLKGRLKQKYKETVVD